MHSHLPFDDKMPAFPLLDFFSRSTYKFSASCPEYYHQPLGLLIPDPNDIVKEKIPSDGLRLVCQGNTEIWAVQRKRNVGQMVRSFLSHEICTYRVYSLKEEDRVDKELLRTRRQIVEHRNDVARQNKSKLLFYGIRSPFAPRYGWGQEQ